MAFPKFHGITLAAGAFIENATLERLAADPVPVAAGRLWYNTTDKVIKFSSLDAGGHHGCLAEWQTRRTQNPVPHRE